MVSALIWRRHAAHVAYIMTGLSDDFVKMVDERISKAKVTDIFLGKVYSVTPLTVVLDGANVPSPALSMQHAGLAIGKRVVLITVGSQQVIVGSLGSRVANFPSYTSVPTNTIDGDAWYNSTAQAIFMQRGGTPVRLGPAAPSLVATVAKTRTGRWYWIQHGTDTTAALGAGARSCVFPFTVFEDKVMTGVVWEITTAGGAGSVTRFGIHNDDRGQPTGGVRFDAGAADATTTGFKGWTGLNVSLPAGEYWIEIASQGGDPTYRSLNLFTPRGVTPGMSSVNFLSAAANPRVAYRYEPRASTFTTLAAHDDSAWSTCVPILQMQFA